MLVSASCKRCHQDFPGLYTDEVELAKAAAMLDWFRDSDRGWLFCPRCIITAKFRSAANFWSDRLTEAERGGITAGRVRDIEAKKAILDRYLALLEMPPERANAAGFLTVNWVVGALMNEFADHPLFPDDWKSMFYSPPLIP